MLSPASTGGILSARSDAAPQSARVSARSSARSREREWRGDAAGLRRAAAERDAAMRSQAVKLAEKLVYLQENVDASLLNDELAEEQVLFLCQHERFIDVASLGNDDVAAIFRAPPRGGGGAGRAVARKGSVAEQAAAPPVVWYAHREGDATGRGDLLDRRGQVMAFSLTPRGIATVTLPSLDASRSLVGATTVQTESMAGVSLAVASQGKLSMAADDVESD